MTLCVQYKQMDQKRLFHTGANDWFLRLKHSLQVRHSDTHLNLYEPIYSKKYNWTLIDLTAIINYKSKFKNDIELQKKNTIH